MAESGAVGGATGYGRQVADFLELATYAVLSLRGVYPASLFELKRYAAVPCSVAAHPALSAYVSEHVRALVPWITNGSVRRMDVVLFDERTDGQRVEMERYVCEFGIDDATATGAAGSSAERAEAAAVARQLSLFIAKLKACESMLGPPPSTTAHRVSFEMQAHSDRADAAANAWMEDAAAGTSAFQTAPPGTLVLPIKAMERDSVRLRLRVERPGVAGDRRSF